MSLPTLEQIAAQTSESPFYCATNQAVLAREILALREVVQINAERVGDFRADHRADQREQLQMLAAVQERLDALESAPARGEDEREVDVEVARLDGLLADARRERDEAYEKLTQSVREHYPPAFRIVVAERDALQQQLAESRAALGRIANHAADPVRSYHADYNTVRLIARDALDASEAAS